jgi:hypothetical protein
VPRQDPGAGVQRRAGGEHVVDQQHPPTGDLVGMPVHHCERSGDIAPPGGRTQFALRGGTPAAAQQIGDEERGAPTRHQAAQQRRLVVSAPGEAGPMQRHRRHQISLVQKLAARRRHPGREARRGVQTVGMLEAQDQFAAALFVGQSRPYAPQRRAPTARAGDA